MRREFTAIGSSYPKSRPYIGHSCWRPTGKRVFDVILTVFLAPVWLPILGFIMIAVKLSDPRSPAIFKQWRLGLGGKPFRILKVRTMIAHAEEILPMLIASNEVRGPQFKMSADPRVTSLGRFLRKTHLDELPQLFNVLVGEMSLVGPRPSVAPVEAYRDWWKARLLCKPGLTGLWQVRQRRYGDFDQRSRLDITYMRNQSPAFDFRILFETLIVSLVHRNGA